MQNDKNIIVKVGLIKKNLLPHDVVDISGTITHTNSKLKAKALVKEMEMD